MKRYILISFTVLAVIIFLNHKVIAQNLQSLYASSVLFAGPNQGSVTLVSGVSQHNGANTITIPDVTGTLLTDSSSYSSVLVALKAIDTSYGSHSGINWTSFGH